MRLGAGGCRDGKRNFAPRPGAGRGTVGKTAVVGVKDRRANRVNAAVAEATDAPTAHTNEVESFWSLLKWGYIRIYHYFSRKHLHRYISEFEGRPNQRPQDTLKPRVLLATGLEGQRLRYAARIA